MSNTSSPSATAIAIASGILGLVVGYFLGQGSSIGLFDSKGNPKASKKSWPNSYDVKVHAESSEEEEADDDASEAEENSIEGLNGFEDSKEEVKLVLAVRTDLGMTKGKIAAQCGHATLACYRAASAHGPSAGMLKRWEKGGQPKIAVQVKSEEELEMVEAQAVSLGLCTRVIHDAGRTQIAAGSSTVCGVLGPKSVVDQVTGGLKLL